eukprot:13570568-Heterocapsa_arctica.AAC.1
MQGVGKLPAVFPRDLLLALREGCDGSECLQAVENIPGNWLSRSAQPDFQVTKVMLVGLTMCPPQPGWPHGLAQIIWLAVEVGSYQERQPTQLDDEGPLGQECDVHA